VLRKILRRGIRHGRLLGQEKPFLFEMVYAVRDLMQGAYPELKDSADRVAKVVEAEENQFDRVLKEGSSRLESEIALEVGRTVERFISIHFQGIDSNAINRGFLQLLKSGIANAERPEAIRWGFASYKNMSRETAV